MKLLSKGFNNRVYALTSGEFNTPQEDEWVAKLFGEMDYPEWELEALESMGEINSVMVKVWGLIPHPTKEVDLLIMERLYPLQPRALSKKKRIESLRKLLGELKDLHSHGWAHGDVKRPNHCCRGDGDEWDNVVPTADGIRLIDAGSAVNVEDPCFEQECLKDLADFAEFSKWFLKDVLPEKEVIPLLREWLNI
jgi:RIO-like serine/threonine protein kinase